MRDLTGKKFGRLTALSIDVSGERRRWNCVCECGNSSLVVTKNLTSGQSKSCGCLHKELSAEKAKETFTKHGLSKEGVYYAWQYIKNQCYNPNARYYKYNLQNNVKVCDRWLHSFENFLEDVGARPSPNHRFKRIDDTKDYCKENCHWVTNKGNVNRFKKVTLFNYNYGDR